MAIRNNGAGLRLIEDCNLPSKCVDLLVLGGQHPRRVRIEEEDTPVPLIDLMLSDYYQLGGLISAGRWGTQISVSLSLMLFGKKMLLTGAVTARLPPASDISVPLGTLA